MDDEEQQIDGEVNNHEHNHAHEQKLKQKKVDITSPLSLISYII